jgi:hypothetical protein
MEKRLNNKIESYLQDFKIDIRKEFDALDIAMTEENAALLDFIYNYKGLKLDTSDVHKRKRVKNSIPKFDRCSAKRANGEQCTRRRKDDFEFCGTHTKGTPHGIVSANGNQTPTTNTQKIEVWTVDIKGILYYIDNFNNVYQTEDIVENKVNPSIVAKYVKDDNNVYSIPEFGI